MIRRGGGKKKKREKERTHFYQHSDNMASRDISMLITIYILLNIGGSQKGGKNTHTRHISAVPYAFTAKAKSARRFIIIE